MTIYCKILGQLASLRLSKVEFFLTFTDKVLLSECLGISNVFLTNHKQVLSRQIACIHHLTDSVDKIHYMNWELSLVALMARIARIWWGHRHLHAMCMPHLCRIWLY